MAISSAAELPREGRQLIPLVAVPEADLSTLIGDLPLAVSVAPTDLLPVDQSGTARAGTAAQVVLGGATGAGANATAIGVGTIATAKNTTSYGHLAQATAGGALAIGETVTASGASSIAIGYFSSATKGDATAIGDSSTASAVGATALGPIATASGISSIALGDSGEATGDFSIAVGFSTLAPGLHAQAQGFRANASGAQSFAFGYNSKASVAGAIAVGASVTTAFANAVGLGGSPGAANRLALPNNLNGTAGQVLVLDANGYGPATISLPVSSVNDAVSAAGTVQGDATLLAALSVTVTTCAVGAGVILDAVASMPIGTGIWILNTTANTLNVYPDGAAQIDALGASVADAIVPAQAKFYRRTGATQWRIFSGA